MKLSRHNLEEDGEGISTIGNQDDCHNAERTSMIENVNTLYIYKLIYTSSVHIFKCYIHM